MTLPLRAQLSMCRHELQYGFFDHVVATYVNRVEHLVRLAVAGVDDVVFNHDQDEISFLETAVGQSFSCISVKFGLKVGFVFAQVPFVSLVRLF